ncbi:hypothetical protein BH11PSE10_BH11PSE10_07560 [soil metagenome]
MFDLTTSPAANFGTPGSGRGITFEVGNQNAPADNVAAVYRNEVRVGAGPVIGDFYTTLELNFTGVGLEDGHYMQFGADTDRIPPTSVISLAVPEPSPALLFGAGIMLMLQRLRLRLRMRRRGHTAASNIPAAPLFSPGRGRER